MSPNELRAALRGLIGFGVTPFHRDLTIDEQALRGNAAHLARYCDIVVALGNNGEIFSLSASEQIAVGRAVVEEVARRKPVLVGTGFSLPDSRELASAAEAYGADGVLILPPHYAKSSEDGLFAYYQAVAATTRLGVVLFQTPDFNFSLSLLRRLAAIPNVVGLKDEHGDMKQFVRQKAAMGEALEMICGVGEILMLSYAALGVKGFTSGLVNFIPNTTLEIMKCLREKRFEQAAEIVETRALPIFDLRAKRPGYSTAIIKEAMNLCGVNVGPVRPPLPVILESDREDLRSILRAQLVLQ